MKFVRERKRLPHEDRVRDGKIQLAAKAERERLLRKEKKE